MKSQFLFSLMSHGESCVVISASGMGERREARQAWSLIIMHALLFLITPYSTEYPGTPYSGQCERLHEILLDRGGRKEACKKRAVLIINRSPCQFARDVP